MLISRRKKFIFFALNKTASTSISASLSPYGSPVWNSYLRIRYKSRYPKPPPFYHAPPRRIKEFVSDDVWKSYYKFCFVRNPFERLVSVYSFQQQTLYKQFPKASQLSFEAWLEESKGTGSARKSQLDFISDQDGSPLLDFVGRYENLERDLTIISQALGLSLNLPHIYKTDHPHYSAYYSSRAREIVEERFKKDLEFFRYKYERQSDEIIPDP